MNGILLLDKPLGLSSNHALQRVKRMLGAEKAGHIGSLDPLATGMLPICLGEATKIATDIVSLRKKYEFTVKLGERTATGDTEGAVVETCAVPDLGEEALGRVLHGFLGRQPQVPPMYSAIKKDGQPLYRLARAGQEIERAAREIEIFELVLVGVEGASLQLETLCAKGTYIRVLAEDIARALGSCGHVTRLRRSYVEPFENEPMETLESIERGSPRIIAADLAARHLQAIVLDAGATDRLRHGQSVACEPQVCGRVRLYAPGGEFIGIGEAQEGLVRPRRLWVEGSAGRIPRLLKG